MAEHCLSLARARLRFLCSRARAVEHYWCLSPALRDQLWGNPGGSTERPTGALLPGRYPRPLPNPCVLLALLCPNKPALGKPGVSFPRVTHRRTEERDTRSFCKESSPNITSAHTGVPSRGSVQTVLPLLATFSFLLKFSCTFEIRSLHIAEDLLQPLKNHTHGEGKGERTGEQREEHPFWN